MCPALASAERGPADVAATNDLAWSLRHTDPERAHGLADEALRLAGGGVDDAADREGAATALTTLGFLERQRGRLQRALAHCLRAADLQSGLAVTRATVDCRRLIAWIHYFAGDPTRGHADARLAVELARKGPGGVCEAAALDALAMFDLAAGRSDDAAAGNARALAIAGTHDDTLLRSVLLNNRAPILAAKGDPDGAMAAAQAALTLAREVHAPDHELAVHDTIGGLHQAAGDLSGAKAALGEATALADRVGMPSMLPHSLLDLGRGQHRVGDVAGARHTLREAVASAAASGAMAVEVEAHMALADVLEACGDLAGAAAALRTACSRQSEFRREMWAVQLREVESQHEANVAARRYSALVKVMTSGVALCELVRDGTGRAVDYRVVEVNPAYPLQTGLPESCAGRVASELMGAAPPPFLDAFAAVVASGRPVDIESYCVPLRRHLRVQAHAAGDHRVVTIVEDVSARVAANAALRASEARFASLFEGSPIAASITRARDGCFVAINRNFTRDFGWTPAEIIGRTSLMLDLWPTAGEREAWAGDLARERRIVQCEVMWLHRSGTRKPIALSAEIADLDGEPHVIAFLFDRTEAKRREAELAAYRQELEERVAARTSELAQATAAAEAANRAKGTFLANMSHEIRTPLNAVLGMAYLVGREGVDDQQAKWLASIETAGRHLLAIVNDILDLSKIDAGRLVLDEREVAPGEVLRSTCELVSDGARGKGLALLVAAHPPLPALRGDATRLAQALLNLVSNAVKYTERGSVTVSLHLAEEVAGGCLIRYEVADTGRGIAPADLARLFAPFEQLAATPGRPHGGTGLGLAITRRLARLMGGDAGATSVPGQGSRFWFSARLALASAGSASSAPAVPDDPLAELRRDFPGTRVLLAEDEPINREVATELLQDAGFVVEAVPNGEEAVRAVERTAYALVLMDMRMPVLDGLDATRAIRALPQGGRLPIVAMTANAFDEDRAACLAAGMDDFVPKPVEPPRLYRAILLQLRAAAAGAATAG